MCVSIAARACMYVAHWVTAKLYRHVIEQYQAAPPKRNNHPCSMSKASHPCLCVLQHVMQYSSSQKHAIFSIRRSYLQQLALISRCRHQLLRQLQAAPGALCTGIADLASNHLTMNNITQKLQGLLAEEHTAYMLYLRKVGHEVGKN
jgi:hypothetical protein